MDKKLKKCWQSVTGKLGRMRNVLLMDSIWISQCRTAEKYVTFQRLFIDPSYRKLSVKCQRKFSESPEIHVSFFFSSSDLSNSAVIVQNGFCQP